MNNNGVNQIFKKNSFCINSNEPNQINNKYTYKKINIKYLDKTKNDIYSFDNINRNNANNRVTSQENYFFNNNNCSFDAPNKKANKLNIKTGYNLPLYMNNKWKMEDNPILNKTFDKEDNDNDIFSKNVYRTKNINVNNKNIIFKKFKRYKDLNFN